MVTILFQYFPLYLGKGIDIVNDLKKYTILELTCSLPTGFLNGIRYIQIVIVGQSGKVTHSSLGTMKLLS